MHVCRMMVCALAKYCSMFHVSPSYIPIWESCTRRYILSVPWTRFIELRVATGKGSRYGRLRSCDHDSILFSPRKAGKNFGKIEFPFRSAAILSIVDLFHVQPYCFAIVKRDTISIGFSSCDFIALTSGVC